MANLRQIATSSCSAFSELTGCLREAPDTQLGQSPLDEFVLAHLWLADSLARRFGQRGQDEQDLIQVARLGLVEAARRFESERGDFLSFAAATIRGLRPRGPSRRVAQECGQTVKGEDWRHRAACLNFDRELFFPIGTTGPALSELAAAQQVCLSCSVREKCLQRAVDQDIEHGVWGGLGQDERRALRRRTAFPRKRVIRR